MSELLRQIKSPKSEIFRRVYIKRRYLGTGLFEDDWQEITDDVIKFGKIKVEADTQRLYKFAFSNARLVVNNEQGRYNPHDYDNSRWYGFLNQQRTLVKYEAGFLKVNKREDIGYQTEEINASTLWDVSLWDSTAHLWDATASPSLFTGVISGDVYLSDSNDVTFNIKPLTSVFQDFPAQNLTGWTSTGMTASQFVTMLRDQTDGSGNFVFRPFFGDTTDGWDISATANIYSNLNTSTALGVFESTVWEVIEKLAEAEDFIPYVTRSGVFKFVSRDANTSTVAFEFHGVGSPDNTYGQTIKSVKNYGPKLSKYYSRVRVKHKEEATTTSYETVESSFEVSPSSNPWVLGHRTLEIDNQFIPTSTVANTIALNIFNEYSSLKKEVELTTSFIPYLEISDRFSIHYDPSVINPDSLWDARDWAADDTSTAEDLIWDRNSGDFLMLEGQEFKALSIEIDLDNPENKIIAREV